MLKAFLLDACDDALINLLLRLRGEGKNQSEQQNGRDDSIHHGSPENCDYEQRTLPRRDVHRAITVRGETNAPVPKHRTSRGARIILCRRNSLTTGRKTPEVLRRRAMISFAKASLKRKPAEKERLPPRIEITLASLPQGEDFLLSIKRRGRLLTVT